MGRRIYPVFVTLLGGVGLGLALTYLVGVVLAFLPGWEDWAEFFVPRAMWLLIPPYVLLMLHMVLRNHVGRYLLNRRDYEGALAYGRRRMEGGWMRSRREVANQRLVVARAYVGMGEDEEALRLLGNEEVQWPGNYAVEARRWQMEIYLRRDEREKAAACAVTKAEDLKKGRGELVSLYGCTAELALRDGDEESYREAMQNGMWINASHPRLGWVRALAMMKLELEEKKEAMALMVTLGMLEDRMLAEIPGREAELEALRAYLMWKQGEGEAAKEHLNAARQAPGDRWAEKEVERVAATLEEAGI